MRTAARDLAALSVIELLERSRRVVAELEAITGRVEDLAWEQEQLTSELARRGSGLSMTHALRQHKT
jgi:hypothetical protein